MPRKYPAPRSHRLHRDTLLPALNGNVRPPRPQVQHEPASTYLQHVGGVLSVRNLPVQRLFGAVSIAHLCSSSLVPSWAPSHEGCASTRPPHSTRNKALESDTVTRIPQERVVILSMPSRHPPSTLRETHPSHLGENWKCYCSFADTTPCTHTVKKTLSFALLEFFSLKSSWLSQLLPLRRFSLSHFMKSFWLRESAQMGAL
jgi:hypothetical protein